MRWRYMEGCALTQAFSSGSEEKFKFCEKDSPSYPQGCQENEKGYSFILGSRIRQQNNLLLENNEPQETI